MKFSKEAYDVIIELLQSEYDLQNGNSDEQERISTIISEVETIGSY